MLKVQEIREIVGMIENSSIQKFEFSQADTRLMIVKKQAEAETLPIPPDVAGQDTKDAAVQPKTEKKPADKAEEQGGMVKITSPMVGTFYAASDPESAPFVKPGQKVNEDTVVCIVEVMKLFNEVHAGVSGQIAEVLVKDGDFVEYGQPLFLMKKA